MPKTIAFFSAYSVPHIGGIESYTMNLSKQLVSLGYRVVLVSSNVDNGLNYWEEDENLVHYRLPVFTLAKNRYPIIKKNHEYHELLRRIEDEKLDAIICNTRFHLTSFIGAELAKKQKIPLHIVEHGSSRLRVSDKILNYFLQYIEKFLTRQMKRYSATYHGVSLAANAHLTKDYNILPSHAWFNSVVIKETKNAAQDQTEKEIIIAYIGRIIKEKGVEILLEAFNGLSEENRKKCQLVIIGDGPELSRLKGKYEQDRVNFLGKLAQKEVENWYSRIDVVVVPSVNYPEGLNSVVLEAGTFSKCLITTKIPGIEEVIHSGENALFAEAGSLSSLKEQLEKVISDGKLREKLGKQLQQDVAANYSIENVVKQVVGDIEKPMVEPIHTFVICAYKKSKYLSAAIESVLNQETVKAGLSDVLLYTSTPNDKIDELCEKYGIKKVEGQTRGIGADWNGALSCVKTRYTTIVHQDDIYLPSYGTKVLKIFEKKKNCSIIYTDYEEIDGKGQIRDRNINLKIKTFGLRLMSIFRTKGMQRRIYAFGNFICCPAVSYDLVRLKDFRFDEELRMAVDWEAWERIMRMPEKVAYVPNRLMQHRIHEESETTANTVDKRREEEEYLMFRKYWGDKMARRLMRVYVKNQDSNSV